MTHDGPYRDDPSAEHLVGMEDGAWWLSHNVHAENYPPQVPLFRDHYTPEIMRAPRTAAWNHGRVTTHAVTVASYAALSDTNPRADRRHAYEPRSQPGPGALKRSITVTSQTPRQSRGPEAPRSRGLIDVDSVL